MAEKRGIFSWYFKSNLLVRILAGLILGAIAGILFQDATTVIDILTPFGSLFINLLKMIVQPVIIFTLIVGTASIAPSRLGQIGVKIIVFYMFTSVIAILIGLSFGNIFNPGAGLQLLDTADAKANSAVAVSMVNVLLSIVPTNPFKAFANGDVLPTIFFSILFGLGLAFSRESKDTRISHASGIVYSFFSGSTEVIFKIVSWVMQYAPIGVFALIFVVFSKHGAGAFGPLASVTLTVYASLIAQVVITYCILLLIFKINPLKFFKKIRSPMLTAFVTRSSGGTLPISMEAAEKEMGISRGVYGFTLPLGATINMDGTTIYLGVCAIFIANAIGMPLTFDQQTTVVLTTVLASIGTAGVPGAGAIMLLMVLESVGLKIEAGSAVAAAYAMILGLDAVLDMGRTAVNVTGDLVGTAIVAKTEKEMNAEHWE